MKSLSVIILVQKFKVRISQSNWVVATNSNLLESLFLCNQMVQTYAITALIIWNNL